MIEDRDKYIEDIEKTFLAQNKKENEYLELLIQRIFDYYNDNKNATYSDYIEEFGTPNEIVISYFDSIGSSAPIRKAKKEPWVKIIYTVIIICVFIYFFFALSSFIEGKNHYISGYKETLIE